MDGRRFDHLAKSLAPAGSRRHLLGAIVAGLLARRRPGVAAAQDDAGGVAIVDAGGGDGNVGRAVDGAQRRIDPGPPCRPASPAELCDGRCNRTVADGCGGRVRCDCPAGLVCGPGDRCCPEERLCLPSDVCCPEGEVCAPGGGVCCAPNRVCTVGGVANACCAEGSTCLGGICVGAPG